MPSEETTHLETRPTPSGLASLPVIEGYAVTGLLGRGGMGRVYLATDLTLNRTVAIKMLIDTGDEMLAARLHTESQAVARLQHPNIAQVFETGHVRDQPFIVLEYLNGGTLAQQLAGKPRPSIEAARLLETLARAIEHSHQHDIIHRDLKPANILLASDGSPKITDFGLAKRLHEDSKLTRTGEVLGTPSYMAPEQASGGTSKVGPAADIYALGAILYEMLTGRPPFQGPDSVQTLMMVLTMDPVAPSSLLPRMPRDLETICLKCLEKSPRKRYASAAHLADDLRRFLDGQPILARPIGVIERTLKLAKRRPAAALLVAFGLVGIIALIVGSLYMRSTNLQLEASNRDTNESLTLARDAIDRMLVRLSDQLAPHPQSDQLRRESLEDARKLYEKLTAIRPGDRETLAKTADALAKLGTIYSDLGRLDDAESTFRKALAFQTELKDAAPTSVTHRRNSASLLLHLANLEHKRGKYEKAESLAREGLDVLPAVDDSADPPTLRTKADIHTTLALSKRARKLIDEARGEHQTAMELRSQWLAADPDSIEAKAALASSLSNLAGLLLIRNRPGDAVVALSKAENLLAGQTSPRHRFYLGQFQANRALAYELLKQEKDALATHAAAIATLTALVADYSSVPGYRYLLAKEHLNLARYHGPLKRTEEAMRHLRIAGPILESLGKEHPDNQQYASTRDLCRQITGWIEEDLANAKKEGATMNDDRLENIETRWSLVRQAHLTGAGASAAQANAVLVMRYASAIRRYVGGILQKHADTEDIAQDVMVRLLKGDFANADPDRGRFRDLLKAAVRNMIRNYWAKQNRRQSSFANFDLLADERENESDAAWTTAWQTNVLDHAWSALKDLERAKPSNAAHTLLRWRAEFPEESSEQLANRLSAKLGSTISAAAARQMLRRARLRFAEFVVREIELGLDDATPARIAEELAALGLLEYVRDFLPDDWETRGTLQSE